MSDHEDEHADEPDQHNIIPPIIPPIIIQPIVPAAGEAGEALVFTESEVRSKISEVKRELRCQMLSVRKPKPFEPEDEQNIKHYIEDFDIYRSLVCLPMELTYKSLLSYLPSKMKLKLRALELTEDEMADWDIMKIVVIKTLTPPSARLDAKLKIEAATQEENETVEDFVDRLRVLVEKCYDKPTDAEIRERILTDTLVRGLRDDTVGIEVLANSDTMSLNDLTQLAMRREIAVKARNVNKQPSQSSPQTVSILNVSEQPRSRTTDHTRSSVVKRCFRCGSTDHYIRMCPFPPQGQSDQRRSRSVRCWNCGGPHHVKFCPSAPQLQNPPSGTRSGRQGFDYQRPGYTYRREGYDRDRQYTTSGRGHGRPTYDTNRDLVRRVVFQDTTSDRDHVRDDVNTNRSREDGENVSSRPSAVGTNSRTERSGASGGSNVGNARSMSPIPRFSQFDPNRPIRTVLQGESTDSDEEAQAIVDDMFQLCLSVTGCDEESTSSEDLN